MRSIRAYALLLLVASCYCEDVTAFAPQFLQRTSQKGCWSQTSPSASSCLSFPEARATRTTQLQSSRGNNQFDLSKPVFDLFALRSIRGDALLRYNTLNQSEPLRINLYAFLALTLFCFPFISEAVGGDADLGIPQTFASILGGFGSTALFVRECSKRSNQLMRMEKELNSESLELRLPMNALSDRAFTEPASFSDLMKTSTPPRLVAICGTASQLTSSLQSLRILGRRLRQANAFVVPIPTDGSTRKDWNLGGNSRLPWLAEAYEEQTWLQYFSDLDEDVDTKDFRWFGFNSNGRTFGSGSGEAPEWLQLLGQYLRPSSLLDETDANVDGDEMSKSVIERQSKFYTSLITGDSQGMKDVFVTDPSSEVTEVVEAGGRIDVWESCLEDGARPEGMQVSGSDAVVLSEMEAYSTAIEFPANASTEAMTATLLAVQEWKRASATDEWKLVVHQTIPWTSDTRAQGTLRCDCRGCVALTRDREQRTFGGMIG
jgi:hypothetical protein